MRLALAIGVLLATAALSAHLGALEVPTGAARLAPPLSVGGWSGCAEPVDERTRVVLGTDAVTLCRYRRAGEEVLLACAQSSGDRKVAHPPEVCLRAAGYEILARETVALPGVEGGAIHLEAARGAVREQVLYWYLADGRATGSYLGQQFTTALRRLSGEGAPAALVRLSTTGDREAGLARLVDLAGAVLGR